MNRRTVKRLRRSTFPWWQSQSPVGAPAESYEALQAALRMMRACRYPPTHVTSPAAERFVDEIERRVATQRLEDV